MQAETALLPAPYPTRHVAAIYYKEAKYEFLKYMRLPGFTVPILLFPVMFYLLFAVVLTNSTVPGTSTYLLATFGTFNVLGTSLFAFGVGVAGERGQGWLEVKRASPMPPLAYFTAKLVVSMVFGLIPTFMLLIIGMSLAGVRLSLEEGAMLVLALVSGAIPFCSMGLAVAYLAGPNSAGPMVNLIYFPMSVMSGLWIPIDFLPHWLQAIAHWLPTYHLAELALRVIHYDHGGPAVTHIAVLLCFTVLCLLLANYGYRRGEGKVYG